MGKKALSVVLIFIVLFSVTGCIKISNVPSHIKKYSEKRIEQTIEYLNDRDVDGLYSLFCETQKERQKDLYQRIEVFVYYWDLIGADVYDDSTHYAGGGGTSADDGEIIYYKENVKINGISTNDLYDCVLCIHEQRIDKEDPDNEGLWGLSLWCDNIFSIATYAQNADGSYHNQKTENIEPDTVDTIKQIYDETYSMRCTKAYFEASDDNRMIMMQELLERIFSNIKEKSEDELLINSLDYQIVEVPADYPALMIEFVPGWDCYIVIHTDSEAKYDG